MDQQPSKNRKPLVLVAVLVVIVIVAGATYAFTRPKTETNDTHTDTKQESSTTTSTSTQSTQESSSQSVVTVNVQAGSYYFNPNQITVKQGQKVKIVLNSTSMQHDLVIDALGVKIPVTPAGSSNSVEFTADKPGTYEFYCSVANHRQMGQVGTLVVQ